MQISARPQGVHDLHAGGTQGRQDAADEPHDQGEEKGRSHDL